MCRSANNTVLLIQIECKQCSLHFFLCRRCYHGQVYCCDQCRVIAQKIAHRKAQSKYRTSEKGREANKKAGRRRRLKINEKSVADEGTIAHFVHVILPPSSWLGKSVCLFCGISGQVVTRFPRRGYWSAATSFGKFSSPSDGRDLSFTNHKSNRRNNGQKKNPGSWAHSQDP